MQQPTAKKVGKEGQPEGPEGRNRLIEAALDCLADYGATGASVRRIADRANVTAGLVRHHFAGKDALLVAAYRHINDAALVRMEDASSAHHADFDAALNATIRAFFPTDMTDQRQMRVMIAFWGLVLTDSTIAKVQRETYAAFQEQFARLIRLYEVAVDDVDDFTTGVISLADGLWLESCLNPNRTSPENVVDIATQFALARLRPG